MIPNWWAVRDLNTRPSGCKPDALTAELTAPRLQILQVTGTDAKRKPPKIAACPNNRPRNFYTPSICRVELIKFRDKLSEVRRSLMNSSEQHEQRGQMECQHLQTAVPKELAELSNFLSARKRDFEEWYVDLLSKLMNGVGRVCRDLVRVMEDHEALPAAAWNARNLAELWVWTRYCTASRENARRFHSDALRDLQGLVDSWAEMSKLVGIHYERMERTIRTKLDEVAQTKLGLESIDANYARVANAARETGLLWYIPVNKFLSKFAHPTAGLIVGMMHQREKLRDGQITCLVFGAYAARHSIIDLDRAIHGIPFVHTSGA
jgi:hypothetical protein